MRLKMSEIDQSEVVLLTGTMFGGKSKMLINLIETVDASSNSKYIAFKPMNDSRDGLLISSRDCKQKVAARPIYAGSSRFVGDFRKTIKQFFFQTVGYDRYVFIDEAQFLSRNEIIFIIDVCQAYRCRVVISGLLNNFKLEYFDSIKWVQDVYGGYFFHGYCNRCGEENAVHNILFEDGKIVTEGNTHHPGDTEYKVYCDECLKEIRK